MAILGVLGIMLGSVYLASFKLFSVHSTKIDVDSQSEIAINDITNTIRLGVKANVCNNFLGSCKGQSTQTPSETKLVVETWPLDANGVPFHPEPLLEDFIVYNISNGNIVRNIYGHESSSRVSQGSCSGGTCNISKILATNIDTVKFEYLDNNGDEITYLDATQVKVTLNFKKHANALPPATKDIEQKVVKSAYFRNN